jgi:hypothetical protein
MTNTMPKLATIRVQNDGANVDYRGDNLLNTVADGIYHLGFAIEDGSLPERGRRSQCRSQPGRGMAHPVLTPIIPPPSSGLDRLTNLIMADRGLDSSIGDDEIAAGADAADDFESP